MILENILQAARIVTGANNYASKHILCIETRREKERVILIFKIMNGMAPLHLLTIVPIISIMVAI